MHSRRSALYQDSGKPYPIYDLNLSFDEYISQCKQLITESRIDLNQPNAEQIINANAPFELRPTESGKSGALLIHGLLDSPLMMRDIGLQLQAHGVLSRAILLPGHGTVPGDLLQVDYHQWLQAVRYGIESFANEVEQLYLIGYSTGASLALYHSLKNKKNIAGMILLAPALKINSAFAGIAGWYKPFCRFGMRAAWLNQDPNETMDYAKYSSITFNAVYQVHQLAQAIKKEQPSTLPLLFALAQADDTICSTAALHYFQQQPNPLNQLILYSNDPEINHHPQITQRCARYDNLRILNFSHLALPISRDNFHYGEEGDYPLASHVMREDAIYYGEFTPLQIKIQEWLVKFKLASNQYQRLTFNPDFDFLMRKILDFVLV